MRSIAAPLAMASFLAACASFNGALALDEIGLTPDDVLASEREDLEAAHGNGNEMDMAEVSRVENLRCSRVPYGRETPNCRYLLRYRKPDGTSGAVKRRNRTFEHLEDGQWRYVIIVRAD